MTTHIYDLQEEFLGTEAAKLIAGAYDSPREHASYRVTLELMRSSYEVALGHFRKISQLDESHNWRDSPPDTSLQSVALQQCIRLLDVDPKGATIEVWLSRSKTVFEAQKFAREELQRWIKVNDLESAYTFILVGQLHETPANAGPIPTANVDHSMIFPPDDLIAAFGPATGMNFKWFKNLADRADLQKARKEKGRPQRGHTRPPLFCPYLVMKFLNKPNHRVGRTLSVQHGWRLLEQHFPAVYRAHSRENPSE